MTQTTVKVYLTRYALTGGIKEIAAESTTSPGYIRDADSKVFDIYGPSDYALTPEDAVKQATQKRDKKIASLEKQIKKLRTLQFEVTP